MRLKIPENHFVGCRPISSVAGILYLNNDIMECCKNSKIKIVYNSFRWSLKHKDRKIIIKGFTDFNVWKYEHPFVSFDNYIKSEKFDELKKSILESKDEEDPWRPHFNGFLYFSEPYYESKNPADLTYLRMCF